MANVTIFRFPSFCEIFMDLKKLTLHDVMGEKIKKIKFNEYLPIEITENTRREKHCNNLLTDGYAGTEISKFHKNNLNAYVNGYTINDIYNILILDKPNAIGSVILWSSVGANLYSNYTPFYENITMQLSTVLHKSESAENCYRTKVSHTFSKGLIATNAYCLDNSEIPVKRVVIKLYNWTGGRIVEITVSAIKLIYNSSNDSSTGNINIMFTKLQILYNFLT